MKKSVIIQNLKCGGCASTVIKQLQSIDGVSEVNVEVETSKVNFFLASEELLEQVKTRLKKIGYPLSGEENNFTSKAKSYISCASGKMNQ